MKKEAAQKDPTMKSDISLLPPCTVDEDLIISSLRVKEFKPDDVNKILAALDK